MNVAANYLNNKTLVIVPLVNNIPNHAQRLQVIKVSGKVEARKLCQSNGWKPWNF